IDRKDFVEGFAENILLLNIEQAFQGLVDEDEAFIEIAHVFPYRKNIRRAETKNPGSCLWFRGCSYFY
ncbi:MAG: hypothetical protein P8100_01760, partial [bacterium]